MESALREATRALRPRRYRNSRLLRHRTGSAMALVSSARPPAFPPARYCLSWVCGGCPFVELPRSRPCPGLAPCHRHSHLRYISVLFATVPEEWKPGSIDRPRTTILRAGRTRHVWTAAVTARAARSSPRVAWSPCPWLGCILVLYAACHKHRHRSIGQGGVLLVAR